MRVDNAFVNQRFRLMRNEGRKMAYNLTNEDHEILLHFLIFE